LRNWVQAGCNFAINADGGATRVSQPETGPATERNPLSSAGDLLDHDKRADTLCCNAQSEAGDI
jgi:hypothetical protein